MQTLLAGAAIGSIITGIFGFAWHLSATSRILDTTTEFGDMAIERGNRLIRIINQFEHGKSGTAKLAVKIARGEV